MNFKKKFCIYDNYAEVQKEVANNLINFFKEVGIKREKTIFEIGCGTGIFTNRFISEFSPKKIFLNDICDVKEYIEKIKYENFLMGDIEKIELPKNIDIVISSSVFQWIQDFPKLIEKISLITKELGFSIYIQGNLKEIKEYFDISLKYYSSYEILEILQKNFKYVEFKEEKIIKNFTTPLLALKHLKNTGVTGFKQTSITKVKNYNKTTLTYCVGYFYCKN